MSEICPKCDEKVSENYRSQITYPKFFACNVVVPADTYFTLAGDIVPGYFFYKLGMCAFYSLRHSFYKAKL